MYQLVLMIHIIIGVCLITLVLVQQGRGANIGAAFGSGASQTVFGSRGSGSFLLKVTIGFVTVFFVTSLFLNHMVTAAMKQDGQQVELPVAPAPAEQMNKTISPSSIPVTK